MKQEDLQNFLWWEIIFFIVIAILFPIIFKQAIQEKIQQKRQCWCTGYMPYNCDKNLDCSPK